MCGRFYIESDTWERVYKEWPSTAPAAQAAETPAACDVAPGMMAGALTEPSACRDSRNSSRTGPVLRRMRWGFPSISHGLIINTRIESLRRYRRFSACFEHRRCVLPAAGFYEWDDGHRRYRLTDPTSPVLYLAGIYDRHGDEDIFSILTTGANDSMNTIHPRMPVLIGTDDLLRFLTDEREAAALIKCRMPELNLHRDHQPTYEQLSLF